jgi:hypothetical protein
METCGGSFEKNLSNGIGKLLSYGDRLVLVKSVVTSFPVSMQSFLEIPKGVSKRLDFLDQDFTVNAMATRESID